ncbi:MAG: hypothetical protein NTZ48_05020, partial [Candidatus Omnitrophica bacterium]|nr:hypothetical protein [Candidatus Omnitrophota bacterium]
LDFRKIKTYSLKSRKSKVKKQNFSKNLTGGGSFISSLPEILAAKDLKELVVDILRARKRGRPVIFMLGAHVIKCGLSSLIIDLMRRKIITAIALNGAGIIHDFELAYIGMTSEDVDKAIQDGSLGMAEETAEYLNSAIREGNRKNLGIGEAVGRMIKEKRLEFKELSLPYAGIKYNIPVTVHIAIGTDIIHMHPSCSGAAIGEASLSDFRKLCETVSQLEGGVVVNFGSAVVLPEVFLKAVSVARNLGFKVRHFTAADFDMIKQYRAFTNVVKRPTLEGKGFSFVGHHEIMIPLLHWAIMEKLQKSR